MEKEGRGEEGSALSDNTEYCVHTNSYPDVFRSAGDYATVSIPLLPVVCSQDASLHSTSNYHYLIGRDGGEYLTALEFFS